MVALACALLLRRLSGECPVLPGRLRLSASHDGPHIIDARLADAQ